MVVFMLDLQNAVNAQAKKRGMAISHWIFLYWKNCEAPRCTKKLHSYVKIQVIKWDPILWGIKPCKSMVIFRNFFSYSGLFRLVI